MFKKSKKIPTRYSEAVIRRTDNTMSKGGEWSRKYTENLRLSYDPQIKTEVNSGDKKR
jgi:hypothetical protein